MGALPAAINLFVLTRRSGKKPELLLNDVTNGNSFAIFHVLVNKVQRIVLVYTIKLGFNEHGYIEFINIF